MSIDAVLARQAGVVSRAQALAAGLSADAVDHRLRTRRWRPLHPRVYLAAGHGLGDEARVRAALYWAGEGAVLAAGAAAWWHGLLACCPAVVAVTVPRGRRPRPRRGVALRRRDLAPADLGTHRGLPVTALPLTVLEAAVQLGAAGGGFLDGALRTAVGLPEVLAAHARYPGAHGSAAARRLLAAARAGQPAQPGRAGQAAQPGRAGQPGQAGRPAQRGQAGQAGRHGQAGQPAQPGRHGRAGPVR